MNKDKDKVSGATAVLQVAELHGVDACFANPGTTEMHFVGAFDNVPSVKPYLTLHETVASGAADGYARMKKDLNKTIPGVTLLHLGPGLMNASANLHNAKRASSSIVNLIGDMSTFHSGSDCILESNIADIAKINSIAVVTTTVPGEIASDANEAFVTAKKNVKSPGLSRVVTFVIPHDRSWELVSKTSAKDAVSNRINSIGVPIQNKQHAQAPAQVSSSNKIKINVPEVLHRTLKDMVNDDIPPFTKSSTLRSLGLTSQSSITYSAMLREELGLECIRPTLMYDYPNLSDLIEYIEDRLEATGVLTNKNDQQEVVDAAVPITTSSSSSSALSEQVQKAINSFGKSFVKSILKQDPAKVGVYVGGCDALIRENLKRICLIFRKLGVSEDQIFCENAFSRVDRGCIEGDKIKRLPYFPRDAMATLGSFETLVIVDAKKPVAMFGYKDQGFSSLIRQDEENVWEIEAPPDGCLLDAFDAIESALEKKSSSFKTEIADAKNAKHRARLLRSATENTLNEKTGKLTAASMCGVVAKYQPVNCVVVDESLTSGGTYWDASDAFSPKFSHLTLTGGAIGFGLSAAVGAAVAKPESKVIALQADGSGLYDCQALWTMARYELNICVVICNNSNYQILNIETAMQAVENQNSELSKSLTSLKNPSIDWVLMAKSFGVKNVIKCATIEEFRMVFQEAMEKTGPMLIEASL